MLDRRRFLGSMGAALTGALEGPLAHGFGGQAQGPSGGQAGARAEQPAPNPQTPPPGQALTFTIDARRPVGAFPHYWESIVGSGRANLALRSDYHADLVEVHQQTGIESVRFHGIFDDDNGVCRLNPRGDVVYNFQYIDQIYDSLLDAGVRPFVELSFMPQALASGSKTVFAYKANVTPPKDMDAWVQLVTAFAQHLFDRYGGDEISRWMFEVWNEPNLDFWAGTQDQYFELYRRTAAALKGVDARLRVGGPATAQVAWATEFIAFCSQHNVPLDFFSTHIYANDPQAKIFGRETDYPVENVIPLALRKLGNQIASSPMPRLPVYITEWNSSFMNQSAVTDTAYNAAFIVETMNGCRGLADAMSYWCFSDVFEEQGISPEIFYGGYGLIAMRRIPKPSLHAFTLLHKLGHERLAVGQGPAMATRRPDGSVAIIVWNLSPRGKDGNPAPGQPLSLRIVIRGLGKRNKLAVTRVDDEHGSAMIAYQKMGSPQYPTAEQLESLRKAAQLPEPERSLVGGSGYTEAPIDLPSNGIALLEFRD